MATPLGPEQTAATVREFEIPGIFPVYQGIWTHSQAKFALRDHRKIRAEF
jgi:hypothetical protein